MKIDTTQVEVYCLNIVFYFTRAVGPASLIVKSRCIHIFWILCIVPNLNMILEEIEVKTKWIKKS